MSTPFLSNVLRAVGAIFVGFFVAAIIGSATKTADPAWLYRLVGWGDVGDAEEQMISIVYIVWGFFLWKAAKEPLSHRLFLDFTLVANIAHFGLMGVQSIVMRGEHMHLVGDVLAGFALVAVLAAAWLPARRQAVSAPV
ncbi:MAG TPA: DUF6632 domain-containing protein [Aeromicrobium sp.]|nr:DUF6632 domain-containing protein [Aeromicrobium sp.]